MNILARLHCGFALVALKVTSRSKLCPKACITIPRVIFTCNHMSAATPILVHVVSGGVGWGEVEGQKMCARKMSECGCARRCECARRCSCIDSRVPMECKCDHARIKYQHKHAHAQRRKAERERERERARNKRTTRKVALRPRRA